MNSQPKGKVSVASLLWTMAVLVTLALIGGAVHLFRKDLHQRRQTLLASSAYAFAQGYLSDMEVDRPMKTVWPYVAEHLTAFEPESDVKSALTRSLHPNNLTLSRDDDYTDHAPVFAISAEGQEILTLTLQKTEASQEGYPTWCVDTLTISDKIDLGYPIRLEVPHGAIVTINGVSAETLSPQSIPYRGLSPFEAAYSQEYTCDRYEPGRFFMMPDVAVVLDTLRLRASEIDGPLVRYDYPATLTSSVSLTVPEGADITLNGIALTKLHQTSSGLPYSFLTRFDEGLADLPTSAVYQISGLFRDPDIQVTWNGIPLADDGNGRYCLPDNMTEAITVCAPEYAVVKLNGVSLGVSEEVGIRFDLPILDGVNNYAVNRPRMIRYHVTGLLATPVVRVTDDKGNELSLCPYHTTDDELYYNIPGTDAPFPDREMLTTSTFAKNYIQYVYSGSNKRSTNYNNCVDMTPSKTLAYQKIKDLYNEVYYYPKHKSITFGAIEALHYYVFEDETYSVVLRIPFTTKLDGVSMTHEVEMEILYAYAGSIRRIINYEVLKTTASEAK